MIELLIGAPLWFHELLALLLTRRLRGKWDRQQAFEAMAMLLAKRALPLSMAHFRAIVLLPAVLKLFDRILLLCLQPELDHSWPQWVCGFRPHRQPNDITFSAVNLIRVSEVC